MFGFILTIAGIWLLVKWIRSRRMPTAVDTYISGAVGVILIAFGLVLIVTGIIIPFSV